MFGRKQKLIERLNEGLALCAARSAVDKEALQWEREQSNRHVHPDWNKSRDLVLQGLRSTVEQKNQLVMDAQRVSQEVNARNTDLRTEIKHLNNQLEEAEKSIKYKNVEISRLNVQVCLLYGDMNQEMKAVDIIREKNSEISQLADKVDALTAQVRHPAYIVSPREGEALSIVRGNRDHWHNIATSRLENIACAGRYFKRMLLCDIVESDDGVTAVQAFNNMKRLAEIGSKEMSTAMAHSKGGDKDVKLED